MTDLVKLRRCDRDHRRRQLWAGEAGDYRTDAGLCCSAAVLQGPVKTFWNYLWQTWSGVIRPVVFDWYWH